MGFSIMTTEQVQFQLQLEVIVVSFVELVQNFNQKEFGFGFKQVVIALQQVDHNCHTLQMDQRFVFSQVLYFASYYLLGDLVSRLKVYQHQLQARMMAVR